MRRRSIIYPLPERDADDTYPVMLIFAVIGLFIRAIAQSGSPLALWGIHNETVDLRAQVKDVLTLYNCNQDNVSYGVECLRGLDWTVFGTTLQTVSSSYI